MLLEHIPCDQVSTFHTQRKFSAKLDGAYVPDSCILRLTGWIHVTPESERKCTVMQQAVRLGRVKMIQELLKPPFHWDVNCDKRAETPLGQLYVAVCLVVTD